MSGKCLCFQDLGSMLLIKTWLGAAWFLWGRPLVFDIFLTIPCALALAKI